MFAGTSREFQTLLRRLSRFASIGLLVLAVGLTACAGGGGGGGGDSGSSDDGASDDGGSGDDSGGDEPAEDHSAEEAAALVDEGVSELEDLLSQPQEYIPAAELAEIAAKFTEAAELDPSNPEAAFYGAVFKSVEFLASDETGEFLSKLGWRDLEEPCATEELIGGLEGMFATTPVTVTTPCDEVGFTLEFGDFGVPIGPGGGGSIGAGGDLSIADLFDFVSGSVADSLGQAVEWLDGIPSGFQTTLTFSFAWGGASGQLPMDGEPVTLDIDYSDAKLIQTVLSSLRAVLVAPTIWQRPGLDQFLADHRDPDTGMLDEIPDDDLESYFINGWAGSAPPLSEDSTAKQNLKDSISLALDAVDLGLASFMGETDDQSDDLVPKELIFDLFNENSEEYDAKAEVVSYFLEPSLETVRQLRDSVAEGDAQVDFYQAIARITDWGTCEPVAGTTADTSPNNDTESDSLPGNMDGLTVVPVGVDPADATVDPNDAAAGVNHFSFTLSAPANVSIFSTGNGDTKGTIGYADDQGQIVTWDFDHDSAASGNFGLSIAASYFDGQRLPHPDDWTEGQITFYVQVREDEGASFQLRVRQDAPAGEIFLKGGGGRNYEARTYRQAQINASLGGLIDVLAAFFDNSQRNTFHIERDPETDAMIPHLSFDNAALRREFRKVFPWMADPGDFADSNFAGSGSTDLNDIQPPSLELMGIVDPPEEATEFGTLSFCAPPAALSPALGSLGGYSPVNVGFTAMGGN